MPFIFWETPTLPSRISTWRRVFNTGMMTVVVMLMVVVMVLLLEVEALILEVVLVEQVWVE